MTKQDILEWIIVAALACGTAVIGTMGVIKDDTASLIIAAILGTTGALFTNWLRRRNKGGQR